MCACLLYACLGQGQGEKWSEFLFVYLCMGAWHVTLTNWSFPEDEKQIMMWKRVYVWQSECMSLCVFTWPFCLCPSTQKCLWGGYTESEQLFLLVIHTQKNTEKPHWAATCIPIVTVGRHLPWPLTFDWSHVLSDCDTLACSCGGLTTGLIYPKLMGSLWAWHTCRGEKISYSKTSPYDIIFLCLKQ